MSPNPIVNMLQPAMANPLAGVFNALKTASNPIMALQNMALNNPQIQQAYNLIQQSGGNAQQAFYAEAQRRCIDPAQTLQQVRSMMK